MGDAKARHRDRTSRTLDAGGAEGTRRAWSADDYDTRLRPQGRGYVPVRSYQVPADRHE
jgi:hypothetical protein